MKTYTIEDAIRLYNRPPSNEFERLESEHCRAMMDTWAASCGTDRFVDLKPYWEAEKKTRKALEEYKAKNGPENN